MLPSFGHHAFGLYHHIAVCTLTARPVYNRFRQNLASTEDSRCERASAHIWGLFRRKPSRVARCRRVTEVPHRCCRGYWPLCYGRPDVFLKHNRFDCSSFFCVFALNNDPPHAVEWTTDCVSHTADRGLTDPHHLFLARLLRKSHGNPRYFTVTRVITWEIPIVPTCKPTGFHEIPWIALGSRGN